MPPQKGSEIHHNLIPMPLSLPGARESTIMHSCKISRQASSVNRLATSYARIIAVVFSDLLCITMTVSLLSNYVSLLLFPCIINML